MDGLCAKIVGNLRENLVFQRKMVPELVHDLFELATKTSEYIVINMKITCLYIPSRYFWTTRATFYVFLPLSACLALTRCNWES